MGEIITLSPIRSPAAIAARPSARDGFHEVA